MTPMTLADPRPGPFIGTLAGCLVGGSLYAVSRLVLPAGLTVGAVLVGLLAGVGARLGRSIGTRLQLRVLIFGSVFITVASEYAVYAVARPDADLEAFYAWMASDIVRLVSMVFFLFAGIFFGVRVLMGGDPLKDVLAYGSATVPPGAAGTPCPRCDSLQTAPDKKTKVMECANCGHHWRPGAPEPPSEGGA